MQADFSVELGRDAPALEIPWHSNDPQVRYYDLKSHPEVVHQIPEAQAYPELASFLSRINATGLSLSLSASDLPRAAFRTNIAALAGSATSRLSQTGTPTHRNEAT